jgi:hypothetical protein
MKTIREKTAGLLLAGVILILSFSGCKNDAAETEAEGAKAAHVSETVYGQVQSVEGSSASLF